MFDRKPSLHFRLGTDKVGQTFDFDQVKLAVPKSPAGELTLNSHSNTWNVAKRLKQRRQDSLAAMEL
ncbi:hypothetical protein GCM10008012_44010 [Rhizobium anhuiense]|nr:hypothetical protein GCM10008012_44010 [Rhizobium anhuiense]